jgi:hypothetical protein
MPTIPSLANYNINPAPQFGSGAAAGAVPGPLGLPPSIYSQVGGVLPNLPTLTGQAGQVVGSELAGQLPSGTIGAIQDAAASFGVQSGMPGSGFQKNYGLESLGLSALQLQQTGLKDYQNILAGLGSTQLSPNLINDIALQNAIMAAAPDPTAAAGTMEKLAAGGGGGISYGGGGPKSMSAVPSAAQNMGVVGTYGATTGATGTATTPGSPYQSDPWYYAGQVGPGHAPANGVGLPGFGTDTATGGDATGFDQNYYDFLVSGGLDPTYFMDVGAGSSDSGNASQ